MSLNSLDNLISAAQGEAATTTTCTRILSICNLAQSYTNVDTIHYYVDIYMCIYICVYIGIYIYIYMYICKCIDQYINDQKYDKHEVVS